MQRKSILDTAGSPGRMPPKSFRNSAISGKVQQMGQWLIIVSWVAVIIGLLTALAIAFDVTAHPQHMKIMNVVWPITELYFPVLGWLLYGDMARAQRVSLCTEPYDERARVTLGGAIAGAHDAKRRRHAGW